jgi:hypothetical protein
MRPRLLLLLAAMTAIGACAPAGGDSGVTEPAGQPAPESRLVVVDPTGAVVTMLADGTETETIAEGAPNRLHFQPQWSPETGRLAWGESSPDGFAVVVVDGNGDRASYPTTNLPYYLAWAPDGDHLAALSNNAQGRVEALMIDAGSETSAVLGSAVPYYFSWDPDSRRIVANRNGDTLDVIDLEGGVTTIAEGSLTYLAPAWTPAGIFHLTSEGIALSDERGSSARVAGVPHAAWFVPTVDGSRLAVVALGGDDDRPRELNVAFGQVSDLTPNALTVIDVETGDSEVVTTERVAGFFWSPDGSTLAVLVSGEAVGELAWLLWRGGAGELLTSFGPAQSFVTDVLRFAPQYALSLRVWSPASDALAFAGTVAGRSGIWVQPADGAGPTWIAEGDWVAWSPP